MDSHIDDTRMDVREQTLLELAKRDTADLPATRRAVTEAAALLVDVARTSIWRFRDDELICEDLFLRDEARHASGQAIKLGTCPVYFATVSQSLVLRARDAHADARTRELEAAYLAPLGIGAMLDTPIWHRDGIYGVLCCEHVGGPREWTEREERDATRMADLIARSIETSTRREVEERSKIILEAIPQYVLSIDENGTALEASTLAQRAVEIEAGSSMTERFADLEMRTLGGELLSPDQWPGERARHGDVVRGEILEVSSRITQLKRWMRATSAPVKIGGTIRGAVVVYEDIGEEARIEHIKREFLTAVAHELRTPTTIAKGYAQRLLKTRGRTPDERHALEAMQRATTRIGHLAENLVDLAAITFGRVVLSLEHVDLAKLALRAIENAAGARTHRIRFLPSDNPARVFVDAVRIRGVISELIDNATTCSPVGRDVEVTVTSNTTHATVRVKDWGIGIPVSAREHVFEPFFRVQGGTPTDVGGLGIGLFLAREIVVRHGGSMSFESTEGEGTTFVISLPVDKESAS